MFLLLILRLLLRHKGVAAATSLFSYHLFDEFAHSAYGWARINLICDCCGHMHLDDLVEAWRFVILCCYYYCSFFYQELWEFVACNPLSPHFVVYPSPPEVLPLHLQILDEFSPYDHVNYTLTRLGERTRLLSLRLGQLHDSNSNPIFADQILVWSINRYYGLRKRILEKI